MERFVKNEFFEFQQPTIVRNILPITSSCETKSQNPVDHIKALVIFKLSHAEKLLFQGAAFLTQTVALDDCVVKFEIWDTAGLN